MRNESFSFKMWGERGLVATLFADINAAGAAGWTEFLSACEFPRSPTGDVPITGALALVEPDFGSRGFGQPDAVVRLQLGDGSFKVIIAEGKRGLWANAATDPSYRGGQGFNSKLNGQLELNHRLAMALSQFHSGATELAEPDWVANTQYKVDFGGRRTLKSAAVLRDVVTPIAALDFYSYLHLVITSDHVNPMEQAGAQRYMPELYHLDYPYQNAWPQLRRLYGWVNWNRLLGVVNHLGEQQHLDDASYFRSTFELNRRNMGVNAPNDDADVDGAPKADSPAATIADLPADMMFDRRHQEQPVVLDDLPFISRGDRGVSLVYAPAINSRTFLHFSWVGESSCLRDYSRGSPFEDRSHRASRVRQHAQLELRVPNRRPVGDAAFWRAKILEANNRLPNMGDTTRTSR